MTGPGVAALVAAWRTHAATLGAYGAGPQAAALARCAAELEAALAADAGALLSLAEAVLYSGTPERTLRAMLTDRRLTNHGRKGKPLFKRAELPVRATAGPDGARSGAYDARADAHHLAAKLRAS